MLREHKSLQLKKEEEEGGGGGAWNVKTFLELVSIDKNSEIIELKNNDFLLFYCCQQLKFWRAITERPSRFLADK